MEILVYLKKKNYYGKEFTDEYQGTLESAIIGRIKKTKINNQRSFNSIITK